MSEQQHPPYRLMIWGLGRIYYRMFNRLQDLIRSGQMRVAAVTSGDALPVVSVDGFPYIEPSRVRETDCDLVVIMNSDHEDEILRSLLSLGVPRSKIVSFRFLDVPYMDLNKYMAIRSRRISILSNNCWGAILSHRLGLEHLSPFKNNGMTPDDFLRFLEDPERHLRHPLRYVRLVENNAPGESTLYPLFQLDGIPVQFRHDMSPGALADKWNERLAKLDLRDPLVIMTCNTEDEERRLFAMDRYRNRLCLRNAGERWICSHKAGNAPAESIPLLTGDLFSPTDGRNIFVDLPALMLGEEHIFRIGLSETAGGPDRGMR